MEDNKQVNKMNLPGMTKQSNIIKLYHGSPNKIVYPTYGMGKDTHDYGRGFYLTPTSSLPKSGQCVAMTQLSAGCTPMSWTSAISLS